MAGFRRTRAVRVASERRVDRRPEKNLAKRVFAPDSGVAGVSLYGEAGVGKTTLAREIAATLPGTTVWAVGSESARSIPFGAFASAIRFHTAGDPAVVLAAGMRAMQRRGEIVLVVDDAHLLDPLSATLVHQLALTGKTPLLLTVRSHESAPDAVSKLWTDGLLTRIAVEPFSADDCRRLVDDMLEAPAEDHAHAYFWSESRGNPLLLRHLVEAAAEQGFLVRVGRFCVLTDRPAVSAELSEIIELRLARLDHAAREVLEVLALGGLIDLDVLAAMCSDPAVEAAERSGFARVIVESGRTKAQVSHPLVEQVLVASMPLTTRRRIAARLAAVLDEVGESGVTEQVRKALLAVESDVGADAAQLVEAAQSALTMGQVGLGERLARHAVDHGGGLPAALALGQALSWQGRGDDAEALMARCVTDETDPQPYIRWVCARAANLFWVCGRPADAEVLLRQCLDRGDEPAMLDPVRALTASFAFYRGDLTASIGCGSRVLASPTAPPLAQVWVASALTQAFAEGGQFEQADAVAQQGRTAAGQCSSGLHRFAVGFGQSAAKIAEGEFAAAGEICREYRELAMGEPLAEAIVDIMAGRLLMFRGRLIEASSRLHTALSIVRLAGLRGWVMVAGSSLAFVESQLGWTEAADAALRVARAADGAHVAVYRIDLRIAEAGWATAVGELSSAVQAARDAAACARARQMFSTEARALSVATRCGAHDCAQRLGEIAGIVGGRLVPAMARHALAYDAGSGRGLDDAADEFERIDALFIAAVAASQAVGQHLRNGHPTDAGQSAHRTRELAARCGAAALPEFMAAQVLSSLTVRRRETAILAARGLHNREIAARLELSTRTVENYLRVIFAELQVSGRTELTDLLGFPTAARPAVTQPSGR